MRNSVAGLWLAAASAALAAGPATIRTISPSQGSIAGGDTVTLTGSGFPGTSLTVDGVAVTPVSISDTQITFRTPAHDNGIASVKVSGNGPNAYAEFLYLPPPLQSLPPGYITTVMGIGTFRGNGRQATSASLEAGAAGLAIGTDGTVYFSEGNYNTIRLVRSDGVMEAYAGTGIWENVAGDGGPALAAQLGHPRGLALDSGGNLLVADQAANTIRRIDRRTGVIATIAGGPVAGWSGDGGPVSKAQLNYPIHVAFDGVGNLYILECGGFSVCDHARVRKVDTNGIITTIAGTGAVGNSGDGGLALAATFNLGVSDAGGFAADASGNVYVADSGNARVRRIDAQTGLIGTLIANMGPVTAVATDGSGNVYIGNNDSSLTAARILKFTPGGQTLQTWGKGTGFSEDGASAADARFCHIERIAVDGAGNILLAEDCSNRIRRINLSTGLLETAAGMGPHIIGETGPALATTLADPGADMLFLPGGEMLVAEGGNYRIRKMDLHGNMSMVAGNGFLTYPTPQDGVPALQASIYPVGLALAANGDILAVEGPAVGTVRIDGSGVIHTVTRPNAYGFGGDGGAANQALLDEPWDVTVDMAGNLYIADTNNNRIRRIDAQTGVITTVAGSGPVNGYENYGAGSYCGDGGVATKACLNTPYGIAVAPDGTMYIGENSFKPNGAHVRKVDPGGTITTLFSGAGQRVRLGPGGNLFMGGYRIEPNGHAFQLAFSNPTGTGLGDGGPASKARTTPGGQDSGVAVDQEGNIFLSDIGDLRIRAIRYGAVIAEPGSTVSATGGTPQTTAAGRTFPAALQVTILSPAGTSENGIRVDFASPAGGALCTFPGGGSTFSALTDSTGRASAVCTANSQAGSYAVTATPLALEVSAKFSLVNTAPPPPTVSANGILNGASFDTSKPNRIAPGALITIFGTGLAIPSGVQTNSGVPVATQLGGTQVMINGIAAPVFAVAGGLNFDQINVQVPFEVAGATSGNVVVRVAGRPDGAPVPVVIDPVAPAVFTVPSGGSGPGAIQHSQDFSLVTRASPARPGETVVIYCTGLGLTSPPTTTGDHGNTAEPLNRTVETPEVTIGGQTARVEFSGTAPCCAALYQINVVVPSGTMAGEQSVVIRMPISKMQSRPDVIINIQP